MINNSQSVAGFHLSSPATVHSQQHAKPSKAVSTALFYELTAMFVGNLQITNLLVNAPSI